MALGGGTFLTQNKVLPGAYINFVSSKRAEPFLSDRGYAAIALPFDFFIDDEVLAVTNEEFMKDSLKIFGYEYTHEKLKGLRDLFENVTTCYLYRLNSGVKASNNFCTAKYSGIRGNDIKISIETNLDNNSLFDVTTYLETEIVDIQTVSKIEELKSNDFVDFKKSALLTPTLAIALTGGTNKATDNYVIDHQKFLEKIEPYSFNAIGAYTDNELISSLYASFTKRMRDEVGAKFQAVVYRNPKDYEGVVSIENSVIGDDEYALILYVTGIISSCKVNKSNTNKLYNGEYEIDVNYKQSELIEGIKAGKFMFHKVGNDVRVLEDINTFVTVTDEKSIDFSSNQTIRVLDQIGNDIAVLFNKKYLGNVANDKSGRLAFWNDLVAHHMTLEKIRAIEDFIPDDVVVTQGESKKSVVVYDVVTPTNAMSKLYMTTKVE